MESGSKYCFSILTAQDGYGPGGKVTGRTKVNIGCVYTSSLPKSALIVTGQTHAPEGTTAWPTPNKDVSVAEHLRVAKDDFTGYDAPHGLAFEWAAPRADGAGNASASVKVDDAMSGLMEKVDVLAEIPYVLRKGLAAVTGTKPFIFQVSIRVWRTLGSVRVPNVLFWHKNLQLTATVLQQGHSRGRRWRQEDSGQGMDVQRGVVHLPVVIAVVALYPVQLSSF